MDERAFFNEKPETRPAKYACPRCRRTNEYSVRWVRRAKKERLPHGADERDRAKFAKLRDHLLRLDDELTCKTCGKRFEIPSLHSLLFVDQFEGLPKDVDEDPADATEDSARPQRPSAPDRGASGQADTASGKSSLPPRFTRKSTGWRG